MCSTTMPDEAGLSLSVEGTGASSWREWEDNRRDLLFLCWLVSLLNDTDWAWWYSACCNGATATSRGGVNDPNDMKRDSGGNELHCMKIAHAPTIARTMVTMVRLPML